MNAKFILSFLLIACVAVGFAEQPKESDYYTITSFQAPGDHQAEVGGIALMPDGKVAVCTRRGQIWTIDNAFTHPEKPAEWKVFAEYLHEPLGLAYKDGWLYAVQRPEVTRLKDEDGDGRADIFETLNDDWGINGNYHEYTFGSRFDKDDNIWCVLCLTGSFTADSLYRGWVLRVNKDGTMTPTACGVRSPGGIGFNAEGDVFYTDNQGAWNGSSSLKWVKPGSFQGNPNGNIWFEYADGAIGDRPPNPNFDIDDRIDKAREQIPTFIPPAVVLPHKRVGNSPTGIEPDMSGGKFGPFAGQTFVGEQTLSRVHRVYLEQVNGIYQGAMFPFLEGFKSGNIGLLLTDDGVMFTGGSNRGWGAKGGQPYAFERVNWTGKTPFEIHEMRARKDGFELTFTEPVDKASATDSSFSMEAFTYDYGKKYGSPEVDALAPTVTVTSVADDGKSIVLKVEPMTKGHVHALKASRLKNQSGNGLLHSEAYYTLNEIPES
ncbi:MAG: hypothetical protein P1U89_17530 [Verrucomicrobiales bacterium]|nr:hypothetical protein [Verrucomicrobiales bacterium]